MSLLTKTRALALSTAIAALMSTASVAAQDFTFNWNPRSGDVWVDQRLGDINQYGTRYREPFIDEMTRYYGAPRDLVTDLLMRQRWAPGDVYYACSIAQVIGRPCRYVVDEWDRDHGQGWGALAQRLGIKPGSAEFHRLKKGFVPTYDRWSRPVVLDADLRRAFPDRHRDGHSAKGKNGNDHVKSNGRSNKAGKATSPSKAKVSGKNKSSAGSANSGKSSGKSNGNGKGKSGGKKD
ncbi:MAG: hypothetical protein M3Q96_02340 [Pseudomonadota bacterium]|nr:hypothetical protein [Pseudomonadota bacterium]